MPSSSASTLSAAPARPLWKTFVVFLMPMMLSNVLQSLSGTVNSIILGNMLGVHALGAVSVFVPLLILMISFVIGLGSGASVLIGQAYGANELGKVKAVAGTTLTVSIVMGLLIAVFGGPYTKSMLLLIGTPPDIMADAIEYTRIFLYSAPLLFIFIIYTTITRGVGDARTPLLALVIQNGFGLLLTPALIRGWGGLPQLGVASGAWATIASFVITITWMIVYLLIKRHPLAPDRELLKHLKVDPKLLWLVLKVGVPTGVQVMMIALSEFAVMGMVNDFGSGATAAYGAVLQIISYVQQPAISIGITASVFGSQAIGRGDNHRLAKITRTGIELQFVITGALIVITYIFSRPILRLFITSPEVVDIAQDLVRLTLWSYLVYGLVAVISGVMRASGAVFWPTVLSIGAIWLIQVPASYLLSHRIGLDGVWIAYPIAFFAMLALQGAYYRLVWQKQTHARLI